MAVETAEERLALLEDFGVDAAIDPIVSGGAPSVVRGLYDEPWSDASGLGLEQPISDRGPTLLCRTADVASLEQGDKVTLTVTPGGGTWFIHEIRPEDDGHFSTLTLLE